MKRVLLCANVAASGFTGGLHRAVLSRLRRHFDVEAALPETAADARAAGAAAAAEGFDLVIAMGGDGVIHHLANGIGGTTTPLGIIPAGTTNVLARLLGIPPKTIPATDFICTDPPTRTVPAAMLTLDHGKRGVESRLATFASGVGLDAAVVQRAEQEPHRKYHLAGLHYARSAASVAWTEYAGRQADLVVSAQGRSVDAVAVFVRLYDYYTYFGRIPIRFGPDGTDKLTVLVARSLDRGRILSVLRRTVTGSHLEKIKGFEVWTGVSSLDVVTESAGVPAQADGELLGSPLKFSVAAHSEQFRVLMPG